MHIKLVTVWFGPAPYWLPQFLERMAANPCLDWTMVGTPPEIPAPCVPMTFEEFLERAAATIRTPIGKTTPRMLCDLRPALAEILSDVYGDATWWGWCDLDLVFGKVDEFITPTLLGSGVDVISDTARGVNGPFTILRNTALVRSMWDRKDFRDMVQSNRLHAYDEERFTEVVRMTCRPSFNAWTSHGSPWPSGPPKRSCELRDGRLYETPTGRHIMTYHFDFTKTWPL